MSRWLIGFGAALLGVSPASLAHAQSATRTQLSSSANPSTAGAPVTLRAEVDGLGGGAPTGRVRFFDGVTQLGVRNLVSAGAGQQTLSGGDYHSCALTSVGGVKCWGANQFGGLGDGTTETRLTPVDVAGLTSGVIAVTTGTYHSCALTSAGGVKCWGWNDKGQIGDGTGATRLRPVNVSGLTSGVVALASAESHNCALTEAGGVKCWGWNYQGQVGDGGRLNQRRPVDVSGLTSGVIAVTTGYYHSCALTGAGGVKCWGANFQGQLGDGSPPGRQLTPVDVFGLARGVVALTAGIAHSCALTRVGGLKCWGENGFGELGDGTTIDRSTPVDVSGLASGVAAADGGGFHSCALMIAGGVKCWGWNPYGAIGDGTRATRLAPVDVFGLTGGAVAVTTGRVHSCAETDGGVFRCWGNNDGGQLGDGTATGRVRPVMTKNLTGLVRARALLTTAPLGAGEHDMSTNYRGDATHMGSTGALRQTVR